MKVDTDQLRAIGETTQVGLLVAAADELDRLRTQTAVTRNTPGKVGATSPTTSVEAARFVWPKTGNHRSRILDYMLAHDEACDAELEEQFAVDNPSDGGSRMSRSSVHTRRKELVDQGWLYDTGRVVEVRGTNRIVWAVTAEGFEHATFMHAAGFTLVKALAE